MTAPVVGQQSDNQEGNNANEERREPPKQVALMVIRGFDSEHRNLQQRSQHRFKNNETGARSQHRLLSAASTTMMNSVQFAHSYKNVKIAGVDAASNEELMLPRQAQSKASIGHNNNNWWHEVSWQQCWHRMDMVGAKLDKATINECG